MSSEKLNHLLIVEDDPSLQKQIRWAFDQYETLTADDRESALVQVQRFMPPVVTMDLGLPPDADSVSEGFKLLEQILSIAPETKVIVLTGQNDRANALRAIGLGAYDFFAKPFEIDLLGLTIERAYRLYELQQENNRLQLMQQPDVLSGLISRDPEVLKVCRTVEKVAISDATVLVLGESGIIACSPPDRRPKWISSRNLLQWPNGAVAQVVSAHDPESLRGPQFDAAWVDELAKWPKAQATWDQLQFALRLGQNPQQVVTTTPRNVEVLKAILKNPTTVITHAPTEANRAYLAESFLAEVEALDNQISTDAQTALYLAFRRLLDRSVRWFLQARPGTIEVGAEIARFAPVVAELGPRMPELAVGAEYKQLHDEAAAFVRMGIPEAMALRGASLLNEFQLLDITEISAQVNSEPAEVAPIYTTLSERYAVDAMLTRISELGRGDRWQALARAALRYDLYSALEALTVAVVTASPNTPMQPTDRIEAWERANSAAVARATQTLEEVRRLEKGDLASLSVALRTLRGVVRSTV